MKKLCQDKISQINRLSSQLETVKKEKVISQKNLNVQESQKSFCKKCSQTEKSKKEIVANGKFLIRNKLKNCIVKAEYTRLQRRIFWYEETQQKQSDYGVIKEKLKWVYWGFNGVGRMVS